MKYRIPVSWMASKTDRARLVALKDATNRKTIGKTLSLAVAVACDIYGVGNLTGLLREQQNERTGP